MIGYLKYIVQFLLLLLFQVLILNNVNLNWWYTDHGGFPVFTPYIYPLFILLLPFETPVWLMLLIGFFSGISVDTFMNTPGMHALPMVVIAYIRMGVLRALLPKNIKEYSEQSPTVRNMGWAPFLTYSAILILVHHALYFTIEIWSLKLWTYTLLKVFASTITTLLLIVVYLLLFGSNAKQLR